MGIKNTPVVFYSEQFRNTDTISFHKSIMHITEIKKYPSGNPFSSFWSFEIYRLPTEVSFFIPYNRRINVSYRTYLRNDISNHTHNCYFIYLVSHTFSDRYYYVKLWTYAISFSINGEYGFIVPFLVFLHCESSFVKFWLNKWFNRLRPSKRSQSVRTCKPFFYQSLR